LGNKIIPEASFDFEQLIYQKNTINQTHSRHVFIAGLARSGTTFLMRQLYLEGSFCSLTYRDMPFVLAPNFWRSLSKFSKRKKELKERAHQDGILVNFDSPEALEEVFWSTFCEEQYIYDDQLIPMQADEDIIKKFQAYISIILKNDPDKRYISKNNNNILRLGSIARAFPKSIILIPFREPIQHISSLMKQHENFKRKHEENPFSIKYMRWLVHHEFGVDHRPFIFGDDRLNEYHIENMNYWLQLWINTYGYILKEMPSQATLLGYEKLCVNSGNIWDRLVEELDISPEIIPTTKWKKSLYKSPANKISTSLQQKATELYNELTLKSL
jgi:sulfotransferase family protein